MRALALTPGRPHSLQLEEFPEPPASQGSVLVETLSVGVCGTDYELIAGDYGTAPEGDSRLIIGHEAVGRVLEAPPGSGFAPGDIVVPIVRHPDPKPCPSCAHGEWDMCQNGLYTEHGIKGRHGFAAERFRCAPEFLVGVDASLAKVGSLVETASVLAKAWEHTERIGKRAYWTPKQVLVTGAGTVGLLAALFGRQRGFEVHLVNRSAEEPKPSLTQALGAHFHTGPIQDLKLRPDVIVECTGAPTVVRDILQMTDRSGIICLTGVSSAKRELPIDIAGLNKMLVLENDVIFGTVNANRRHYEAAAQALAKADRSWLERLITRRTPLEKWQTAYERGSQDVKTLVEFQSV